MPSSHYFQINEIVDLIVLTQPGKVLDIGVGFGKFGFLAREYLELWKPDSSYNERKVLIDGIEAYEPYLTPAHRFIYDNIYIGNALELIPTLQTKYDLILMIDVFEHFSFEEGTKLLNDCRKRSRNILISVPIDMSPQEAVYGNPYEIHQYPWSKKDFHGITDKFFLPNQRSLICYIGEDSLRLKKLIRKRNWRASLVSILEFIGIKKALKKLLIKS